VAGKQMKTNSVNRNALMCGYDVSLFIGDIDVYKIIRGKEMDYYKLPKDDRWLGDDNPCTIGGRNTDIEQIAFALSRRVREIYPINEVPFELAMSLGRLEEVCMKAGECIQKTIDLISEYRYKK